MLGRILALLRGKRRAAAAVTAGGAALGVMIAVSIGSKAPSVWPDATNTGVPAGTVLTTYAGGCSISSGTVTIDSKNVKAACPNFFVSGTATVTVTSSAFNTVQVTGPNAHLTMTDSDVDGGAQTNQEAVGVWNGPATGYGFTGTRLNLHGGKDGVGCDWGCNLVDSYLHDWTAPPNGTHMQAFLSSGSSQGASNIYLKHNWFECRVDLTGSVPFNGDPGGCTADLSLFGDGGTISGVTLDGNYFRESNTWSTYCVALGYNTGKNFPNPDHVVFTNNVFEVGASGKCGSNANTAFWKRAADGATGNVWSNNTTTTGTQIPEPASG